MEIDKWIGSYKVRAFPWIDGKRIYFNVMKIIQKLRKKSKKEKIRGSIPIMELEMF